MAFVHLHTHSQFSILDGTASPEALAAHVAALGQPACALTDSSNLFGAVAFYKACKAAGIRAIIGAELDVQPEGTDHIDGDRAEGGYKVVVLVENQVGYQNICALVTKAIFDGNAYKPRVDLAGLAAHREGLLVLTGGRRGPIGRELPRHGLAEATETVAALSAAVGPNRLFLELVDRGLDGEDAANQAARAIAAELGLATVVTNGTHYLNAEDAPVHEVLNAISTGQSVDDVSRVMSLTDQAYVKTEEEMRALFPDDGDAIDRTVELAERCDFHFDFGTYHLPAATPPDYVPPVDGKAQPQPDTDANWAYFYRAYPPPIDYGLPAPEEAVPDRPEGAGNLDGYFDWYSGKGLTLRLERIDPELHATYWDRLTIELGIIKGMGFPAYLLIVAEFINWSKDNAIPVGPGRGSAAGSLVCWAQRITDIDPIKFTLLFERFLNPERVSMPDIDVDFCQDRREEVIEHVRQKYGSPLVSQIITYGRLKAKAAIRDIARSMALFYGDADRISKLIPDTLGITLQEALDEVEQLRTMREMDPKVRRVIDTALAVEGAVRQTGVHAAGVVIGDRPLVEYAPLYRDEPGGGPVVQYDMKSAESIGLIKFDFLGLKTLDQIRDAVVNVKRNYGIDIDMSAIPVDDETTYKLLEVGDALGIFQLESSGMRELLARLRPSNIDDMVALVALYRPGPLKSGMTDDFVLRKHDADKIEYPLDILIPILKPTYGTIVYQEQVMQVAQVMAGYSLGEADLLRRAMGKKKASEMEKQRVRFLEGSIANNIDAERAGEIFDLLAQFAAYGFNKSHSAAYGYISYQTAWLKAHYRPEYMAALMTIEAGNTEKVLMYIDDCKAAGIRIDPVCVNNSEKRFDVPAPADRVAGEDSIRFGLAAVKNVGSGAVDNLLETRAAEGGAWDDAFHFFRTLDYKRVNKRVVEHLVKAGALDWTGLTRRTLFEGLPDAISAGQRIQADAEAGQASLFSMMPTAKATPQHHFHEHPEWPLSKRLGFERDVLGMYQSGHPMESYRTDVERYGTHPIARLGDLEDRAELRVVGLPGDTRVVRTRRGDKMAFVQLTDVDGAVEAVFFADAWTSSQKAIQSGEAVVVTGRAQWRDGEVKVRAESAQRLVDVRSRATKRVIIELGLEELTKRGALDALVTLLGEQSGECETRLCITGPDWVAELELPNHRVEPGLGLEEGAEGLYGRRVVTLT
ncbi:MAG: DNA polymerase-3 subunit alpha [bacterium]|jgi:DNA polymerase-3 subunit alpha